jgi:hypothetical protein
VSVHPYLPKSGGQVQSGKVPGLPQHVQQVLDPGKWKTFSLRNGIQLPSESCDLHLEHLNRICKNAISDLGVNKTETAIARVGKTLGTLSPTLEQYDLENRVPDSSGTHRAPKSDKSRDIIIHQLQQSGIFLISRIVHTTCS